VVVDQANRPIGLISITDVQRALRASQLGARGDDRAHALAG
jgi:CBS domain-containing protein